MPQHVAAKPVVRGRTAYDGSMCLGVPGLVVEITPDPLEMPMGKVSFGGALREVCFAYVPEAKVGDYVLVHVGFALNTIDEEEAKEVLAILEQMGESAEPEGPPAEESAAS